MKPENLVTKIKVFCLGDSNTYGVDVDKSYVDFLRDALEKNISKLGADYVDVYNLGVCSDTSTKLANRCYNEIDARLDEYNTAVVGVHFIVFIGINDYFQHTPIVQFKLNLERIVTTLLAMYPGVHRSIQFVTFPWFFTDDYGDSKRYNTAVQSLVDLHKEVGLVELAGYTLYRTDDGIHLTEDGHQRLCELMLGVIISKSDRISET